MNTDKTIEILLVEDNPSDVKLTMNALQRSHISNRVFVAWDGEEALDYLFSRGKFASEEKNRKLKLVLLDLKLPKVDGLEVLKIIKEDDRTKLIPVVVLTSSKEERDIVESYKLGVNSYIVKPLDFDQFMKSVTDIGLYWLLLNEIPEL